MKKWTITALAIAFILQSCGGDSSGNPSATNPDTLPRVAEAPAASKGQTLFQTNCQSCHSPVKVLVGPPLKPAFTHWKNKEDLYEYINDPAAYMASRKDSRLLQLKEQYAVLMPPFSYLSKEDIDSIVQYIQEYPE